PIVDGSGNLYGMTHLGGTGSEGAVFKVRTDGSGFAVLHSFTGSDGAGPYGGVVLDASGYLYGTTGGGGAPNLGTIFKVKPDGTGFSTLYSFSGSDGALPYATPILDGSGYLYGTTRDGGASSLGNVYKIKTDGSGFATIHHFASGTADGQNPYASLLLDAPS